MCTNHKPFLCQCPLLAPAAQPRYSAAMIKITSTTGTKGADKSSKSSKPTDPNAPKFADLLDIEDVSPTAPVTTGGTPYAPIIPLEEEEDEPTTGKQLLATLEDLAADVLTGTPTAQADKLEKLLANLPDYADKTPAQKQVLDELATRAATTLAQLRKK
jgi:hypothetical protein